MSKLTAWPLSQRVVAVSKQIKNNVMDLNPTIGINTEVVYNSSVWEHEILERKSIGTQTMRLVYSGRLVAYQKRVMDFIDLAFGLDKLDVPYEMTLIGAINTLELEEESRTWPSASMLFCGASRTR